MHETNFCVCTCNALVLPSVGSQWESYKRYIGNVVIYLPWEGGGGWLFYMWVLNEDLAPSI